MNLFFVTVFGIYFVGMLLMIIGWQESLTRESTTLSEESLFKKITVVIPFRNEGILIDRIIIDLFQQHFLLEQAEVIFVNDHSTDHSIEIVSWGIAGRPNFKLISLPEGRIGKKQAIAYAIENATGKIMVTTDADCRLPVGWLASVRPAFDDVNVKMVFGGVRMEADGTPFSILQALEFCSLIGVGASTATLRFPVLCNGANLAFLKSAFVEVGGYEGNLHIPSGDDEFLMNKINDRYPGSISFLPVPESVVTTRPLSSRKDFLNQRLRWAGKWRHNTSFVSRGLGLFVLILQVSFFALWLAPLLNLIDWRLALFLFTGKALFEYVFLYQVSAFLNVHWKILHFLALQFLYPFYVVFVGVASFFKEYEWKGRRG